MCRATVRDPGTGKLRACKKSGDPLCATHTSISRPCHFQGCQNYGPITKKGDMVMDKSVCFEHLPGPDQQQQMDHGNCLDIVLYQADGGHLSTTYVMEDICMYPGCMNPEDQGAFCRHHVQHEGHLVEQAMGVITDLAMQLEHRNTRDRKFQEADVALKAAIATSMGQRIDAVLKKHLSDSPPEFIKRLRSHYTGGGGGGVGGGQGGF